jgi:predicted RNA-binding protein with PUA-like domain
MQYWIIKAEPEMRLVKGKDVKFSIHDLQEQKTTSWEGVRNYEARNNMKKMKVGDICMFYHSNCKLPGLAGVATVIKESHVDGTISISLKN